MDTASDKRAVGGPADAPTWAVAVGVIVLLLVLCSVALIAAGGWNWFAAFLVSATPNWIQAIGSIVAIIAAGLFIKWQLKEQALQAAGQLVKQAEQARDERREADVHRLQLMGGQRCSIAG